MSSFVRASKVRHVYCEKGKPEHELTGLKLSQATGDHQYIKANTQYFAVPVAQGGGLGIFPMEDVEKGRRISGTIPIIDGHTGPVLDFDFNPLNEDLITTGADDCLAMVWRIPEGGLTENLATPESTLEGHIKKITVVSHHNTVNNVVATGSADGTVKVWDISSSEGEMKTDLEIGSGMVVDVKCSSTGELWGTTFKAANNKSNLYLFDGRNGEIVSKVEKHHEGGKPSKLCFLPGHGPTGESICTTGFTRQSKRQFKLWDMRKLNKEYHTGEIDQGNGVFLPFWDEGTKLLYLAGKGDTTVRYWELVSDTPWSFIIGKAQSNQPSRGACMVPKRGVDVTKKEVATILKLKQGGVEKLSMICPRKSALFQKDLYPDEYAGESDIEASTYFESTSERFKGKINKISMDPKKRNIQASSGGKDPTAKKKKTYKELEKEVKRLEGLLKQNNIKF